MFSCYNQILVCGVHLCFIFFYIEYPLQKTKWNCNVIAARWTLCLNKTMEKNMEKKDSISPRIWSGRQGLYICHMFAYSLFHYYLSMCGSRNFKRGWGVIGGGGGVDMKKPYLHVHKKSNMLFLSYFPYWISIYDWFQ